MEDNCAVQVNVLIAALTKEIEERHGRYDAALAIVVSKDLQETLCNALEGIAIFPAHQRSQIRVEGTTLDFRDTLLDLPLVFQEGERSLRLYTEMDWYVPIDIPWVTD